METQSVKTNTVARSKCVLVQKEQEHTQLCQRVLLKWWTLGSSTNAHPRQSMEAQSGAGVRWASSEYAHCLQSEVFPHTASSVNSFRHPASLTRVDSG
jgi:hypothetical protein